MTSIHMTLPTQQDLPEKELFRRFFSFLNTGEPAVSDCAHPPCTSFTVLGEINHQMWAVGEQRNRRTPRIIPPAASPHPGV